MNRDDQKIENTAEAADAPEKIEASNEISDSADVSASRKDLLIRGVYDAEEFADELWDMRENGIEPGVSTGWKNVDEHYTVKLGQWTVITGVPGYGKSTFLDNLLVNLARLHNWKFLYFSFENQPVKRHISGLMEIYAGRVFGQRNDNVAVRDSYKMTDDEYMESFQFVNDHFRFVQPEETDCTVTGIIDIAQEVRDDGFEFHGLVTDPYNELEHRRPAAMTESEYISWVISKFRRFARRENFHWWMVAHPTKLEEVKQNHGVKATTAQKQKIIYKKPTLYSISGSAHWRNKADMGIVIHQDEEKRGAPCEVEVQKVRFKECGSKGQAYLYFDYFCSRMVQHEDELLHRKYL